MNKPNGSTESFTRHVEQLSDVRDRLARLEGQATHFATQADIANAKVHMYLTWGGAAVSILIGLGVIISRVWPAP